MGDTVIYVSRIEWEGSERVFVTCHFETFETVKEVLYGSSMH